MVTLVSPHLDDAVLSCWHLLAADDDVSVVNVFTGPPEDGVQKGHWAVLTMARDSAARTSERVDEDRRALALVGREPVNLGLPEAQYRRNGLAPRALVDALAGHLRGDGLVYVPAAIGHHHADHAVVLAAALASCEKDRLRLYADLPHANMYGWPGWVTGDLDTGGLDVDAAWAWAFENNGLDPDELEPELHALDDAAFEQKLAAVRAYRTQAPVLARLRPFAELRHELVWRFRAETMS